MCNICLYSLLFLKTKKCLLQANKVKKKRETIKSFILIYFLKIFLQFLNDFFAVQFFFNSNSQFTLFFTIFPPFFNFFYLTKKTSDIVCYSNHNLLMLPFVLF